MVVATLLLVTGCTKEADIGPGPGPGPAKIDVDTPELQALKAEAGMEDCTPGASGAGAGALPALTLPCLGGGTAVDLSSLRGPLVLSLWQAACAPCRKEMPALQQFHETYGDRVPVVGVDFLDPFPASALEEIGQRKVTYPSLADPGGDLQAFVPFSKFPGFPTMYFVDAKGEVTYQRSGGVESADEVADLVRDHLGVTL